MVSWAALVVAALALTYGLVALVAGPGMRRATRRLWRRLRGKKAGGWDNYYRH